ncbi:MAG TPA: serine hydrolase, partial [Victivallales bacterium]|nr:serine hydrolase [Victivallales bacterium]
MKKILLITSLLFIGLLSVYANSRKEHNAPGKNWMQYKTPEEAGWSAKKLKEANDYFKKIDGSTVMLIYKGKVVVSWGNVEKDFIVASIRKVFLSSIYGKYVDNGTININDTLQDINFNDKPPLTHSERQATIFDMLTCRSGISRKGANAEGVSIKTVNGKEVIGPKYNLPPEAKPGTVYYYSNWDFNAVGGIFKQLTGKSIFKTYYQDIAKPIGMQDFSLIDTFNLYNKKVTLYPAYNFLMSTRDMARFGLLFLNKGNWNGKQVIPKKWIKDSTKEYYKISKTDRTGVGYFWFIFNTGFFKEHPMIQKAGTGEQVLCIFPKDDIVLVIRANPLEKYTSKNYKYVTANEINKLLELLINAKTQKPSKNPVFVPLKTVKSKIKVLNLNSNTYKKYIGNYKTTEKPMGAKSIKVYVNQKQLIIELLPIGVKFELLPISEN